jgi:hypothetical protein
MLLGLLLVINAVACFVVMISHPTGMTTSKLETHDTHRDSSAETFVFFGLAAKDFGISIVYGVGIMATSFFLWYRPGKLD